MSTRLASLIRISLLALAVVGATSCELIDDIIDDIHDPGPGPAPTACASTAACAAGSVCTVERGVCNPPPGCRAGQVCPAVCYGTCEVKPTPPAQCRVDADCRAFAFMCTGCECLALGPNDREPVCRGPGVQCLVDPCLDKTARCDAGRCAIAPPSACGTGTVPRRVCTACGPAGGCATETDCARVCAQDSDCGANQTRCLAGLCQVQGCI